MSTQTVSNTQDEKHPMTSHQQKFCSTVAELIRLLCSTEDTVEKVAVFYHQGCPDGIVSALLMKYASINDNVIPISAFWDLKEEVIKSKLEKVGIDVVDETVAIVEVDVVIPAAQELFNSARLHAKIDHHVSQREICQKIGGICIDNVCAAAIVAEMFFQQGRQLSKAMKRLLEVLDHKDRYTSVWKTSRNIQALWEAVFQSLRFMDRAETLLNELMKMNDDQSDLWISSMTAGGELLLSQRDDSICGVLLAYLTQATFNGIACIVVNFDTFPRTYEEREKARANRALIADILSSIFKMPVFIIATPNDDQSIYMISAGSSAECELTGLEIAQQFGGKQGHRHFAGFSTSHDEFNKRVTLGEKLELTADNWKEVKQLLLSPDE